MSRVSLLHRRELLGGGRALIFRLPGLVGHAVDRLAALVLAHGDTLCIRRILEPVGQAVTAEAGEVHQIEVLDIGPPAQMFDKTPESGGFKFRSGFVIDGHVRYPAVAELPYHVDLVTDFAIS